jgi:B12-binding domain/radical SAM domain protein
MSMFQTNLILLHAPSVYDFRQKPILFGPVSDVIPSTQIFEMYPIGFMTIMGYLQQHGYSVRIINVALKMLRNSRFDVDKLIRKLKPRAFGIDLHWMVHAHGSLELAKVVKRHHPDIPVIFGGLSASFFHQELIQYPQVDYVVRGESAEEPLRQLLSAISGENALADVPNLVWKDAGEVRCNPFSYSPKDLAHVEFDYRSVMKATTRYVDFFGHLPFNEWLQYPIVCAVSCRGCIHNCVTCGGSASAYTKTSERAAPAFRDPDDLARDVSEVSRYIHAPVIILGDILQSGDAYATRFLTSLKARKMRNHVAFEFFVPPSRKLLKQIADAVLKFNIQISPESHDEGVRRRFGRPYDNGALERMFEDARELGCQRMDVFFMIGLAGQTAQSVRDTIGYCRTLMERFGRQPAGWLHPYISPLAPFLDPGSRAFAEPEKYGYRLLFRTLEEHRQALAAPGWKYTLNYETEWMTRDEIAESTYDAAFELNRLKAEYGLQDQKTAGRIEERITEERDILHRIDGLLASGDESSQLEGIAALLRQFDRVGPYTLCDVDEMKWPVQFWRFNPLRIMQGLLSK